MSVENVEGRAVHFPKDELKFEFDEEVSACFPDMSRRSIPLFKETHRLHAHLAAEWVREGCRVLDAGASRGEFINQMADVHGRDAFVADMCDNSLPMIRHLEEDFPWANVWLTDITSEEFAERTEMYDVINCSYVIQFIPEDKQCLALRALVEKLKPGGVLFLGQKEGRTSATDTMYNLSHEEYLRFRRSYGYSAEEIAAKTKALEAVMKPMSETELRSRLSLLGMQYRETSRWTVFYNLMCIKGW